MSNSGFIPRKDNDFFAWAKNFVAFVNTNYARINFPSAEASRLDSLYITFFQKLEAAETPEKRTQAVIQEKIVAREALEHALRQDIKEYLTYNHLVTDADRDNMGLPIHKTTHTPAPIATTYPDFDIDSSTLRRLTIHFYDQGQKKSKAKPVGQHGAEIVWAILDAPPKKVSDLIRSSFDTHTPLTLDFEEDQRGQTVYFCLRWENTRGEKGPWSDIHSAFVP
ncbi:MAG: hypothetical protein LBJ67_18990 [Planctomycetaceae bacterium]|jgi:hypothetical protein|nr:hypothetical protein [Planctomycetaceae bacterium]